MKLKVLLFGLICLSIMGCENTQQTPPTQLSYTKAYSFGNDHIYETNIDGHDYLIFYGIKKGGICHKANCSGCKK